MCFCYVRPPQNDKKSPHLKKKNDFLPHLKFSIYEFSADV